MSRRSFPLALLPALLLAASPVLAGTICGTVTDARTLAPVANAGVFVRAPDGAYAGLYGATDEMGHFCIAHVPAGTWDLQVRVDDYQVAYLRGVVVSDSGTNVEIPVTGPGLWLAPPSPNPAQGRVTLRLALRHDARFEVAVFDLGGRLVRRWAGDARAGEPRAFVWDGRDARGRDAPAGCYLVILRVGDQGVSRPLVLLP